jgi:type VI protein secretion system component VasK
MMVANDDETKAEDLKTEVGKAIEQTRTLVDSSGVSDEWRQPLLKLLLTPLEQLDRVLKCRGQRQLTLEWQAAVMDPMAALVNKYPFVAGEATSASIEEIAKVFHPTTGAITTFRDNQLTKLVVVSGNQIMAAPGGRKNAQLDPGVIELLNKSLWIGQTLFEGEKPGVGFDLILECSSSVGQVSLTLDGKLVSTTCRGNKHQLFWPERARRGAQRRSSGMCGLRKTGYTANGEWGLWQLLEKPRVTLMRQESQLLIYFDLPKVGKLRWQLEPKGPGAKALFLGQTLLAPFRESVFRHLPVGCSPARPARRPSGERVTYGSDRSGRLVDRVHRAGPAWIFARRPRGLGPRRGAARATGARHPGVRRPRRALRIAWSRGRSTTFCTTRHFRSSRRCGGASGTSCR